MHGTLDLYLLMSVICVVVHCTQAVGTCTKQLAQGTYVKMEWLGGTHVTASPLLLPLCYLATVLASVNVIIVYRQR